MNSPDKPSGTQERKITTHHNNEINKQLDIYALDTTPSGAPSAYSICEAEGEGYLRLQFHTGDGKNVEGITIESLLAVVQDRLECWNRGPYACRENVMAVRSIQQALLWMARRAERIRMESEREAKKKLTPLVHPEVEEVNKELQQEAAQTQEEGQEGGGTEAHLSSQEGTKPETTQPSSKKNKKK